MMFSKHPVSLSAEASVFLGLQLALRRIHPPLELCPDSGLVSN